jgi:hypothetical protein
VSLRHEFAIIEKGIKENLIDTVINPVFISDEIILYLNDSVQWIDTYWNGIKENKGLNYYGYTIIECENINKLNRIIVSWISLFETAPDEFFLTGNYMLDEAKYEKNLFNKQDVLSQLNALNDICIEAIKINKCILHNGI